MYLICFNPLLFHYNIVINIYLQSTPRVKSAVRVGESKKEADELLNSILPPKEWEENGKLWRQEVSTTPATRLDVVNVQEQLDMRLQQRQVTKFYSLFK